MALKLDLDSWDDDFSPAKKEEKPSSEKESKKTETDNPENDIEVVSDDSQEGVFERDSDFDLGEEPEKNPPVASKKSFEGHNKDIIDSKEINVDTSKYSLPNGFQQEKSAHQIITPPVQQEVPAPAPMEPATPPPVSEQPKADDGMELNMGIETAPESAPAPAPMEPPAMAPEAVAPPVLEEQASPFSPAPVEVPQVVPPAQEIQETPSVTKVLCIGGNEMYFKTTLSRLKEQVPDIDFIKFTPSGGKNAFYLIDTMNPDIILIHHNAQMQTAIQFYDTVCNGVDDKGMPYRQKYANKRVIVIAPNDISYEMRLREKGLSFFVKELNTKTHIVDLNELVRAIYEAKKDILSNSAQMGIPATVVAAPAGNAFTAPTTGMQVTPPKPIEAPMPQEMPVPQQEQGAPALRQKRLIPSLRNMQEMQEPQTGKIISVYSGTGGAGKTMFATNLATILSKYSNMEGTNDYKVCLLEYNLGCQAVDMFFNVKMDKNVGSLAQEVASFANDKGEVHLSPERMQPYVSQYVYNDKETGLDILLGISVPLEIDRIQKGFTTSLLSTLREMYDVVVIDMATDLAKTPVLEAFTMTDVIYYIMPMDVASIRNTRVLNKFFTGLFQFSSDRIKVILNKVVLDNEEFGVNQVYEALANDNCVPEGTIPSMEKEVLSSINRGVPIALENLGSPIAQAIYSIALGINPMLSSEGIFTEDTSSDNGGGFLSKLFGGKKKGESAPDSPPPAVVRNKAKALEKPALKKPEKAERPAIPAPSEKRGGGLFGKKKQESEKIEKPKKTPEVIEHEDDSFEGEKPKKMGFFARLFGGGKKKDKAIKNEKRSGGLLKAGTPAKKKPVRDLDDDVFVSQEDSRAEEPKKESTKNRLRFAMKKH